MIMLSLGPLRTLLTSPGSAHSAGSAAVPRRRHGPLGSGVRVSLYTCIFNMYIYKKLETHARTKIYVSVYINMCIRMYGCIAT